MKKLSMLLILVSLCGFLMSCASSRTFPGRCSTSGCGSGGGNNGTLQTGNWAFTLNNTSRNIFMGGALSQSSTTVTGTFAIAGDIATGFEFSPANPLITMTGTVNNSSLTLTGTYASSTITLKFTNLATTGEITSMSGTYTVTGGSDSGDSGTVTATLAGDFSGTWQGTDTSTGGVFSITVSEGANSGGIFPFANSATAAFSGGTGCAVTGAFSSGFVAGSLFYVDVATSDGGTPGDFGFFGIANNAANPTSISGFYNYSGGTSCLFQDTNSNVSMTLTKQ